MIRMRIFSGAVTLLVAAGVVYGLAGCARPENGGGTVTSGTGSFIGHDAIAALVSTDPLTREAARNEIAATGSAAVLALEQHALETAALDARWAAVRMLGDLAAARDDAKKPAVEALVRLYMKNDRDTCGEAAAALRRTGASVIPAIAEAATSPSTSDAMQRHGLILMVSIDRKTAIDGLVGMLGDPARADRESTVVRALRSLTGFTFDYDPAATPEQKKAAVEAWHKWWEKSKESY